jgi:hypothetical protein
VAFLCIGCGKPRARARLAYCDVCHGKLEHGWECLDDENLLTRKEEASWSKKLTAISKLHPEGVE